MHAVNDLKKLTHAELEQVNQTILSMADTKNSELVPIITKYLQDAGGKRLRPMLTLAFAKLTDQGANIDNVVRLATSVELIHTATLLHDDVVDEGSLRRGNKTTNAIWGNKTAILLGDYLFSQSFKLMVETANFDALQMLAATSATIAEAEVRQIEMTNNAQLPFQRYLDLIRDKTAILFAAACRCGAYDASPAAQQSAYDYGLNLGMAFQIIDDTLDYFASEHEFGKKIGGDLTEKKYTLPLYLLVAKNLEHGRDILNIFDKDQVEQHDIDHILKLLHSNGVLEECKEFAQKYIHKALDCLEQINHTNPYIFETLSTLPKQLNERIV